MQRLGRWNDEQTEMVAVLSKDGKVKLLSQNLRSGGQAVVDAKGQVLEEVQVRPHKEPTLRDDIQVMTEGG